MDQIHAQKQEQTREVRLARTLPFRPWVERGKFKSEGADIGFSKWRALGQVYDMMPSPAFLAQPEFDFTFVLMCAAQTGKSVWMMLAALYFVLRFAELRGAYYMPTDQKAHDFSKNRFLTFARENPAIHALMGDPDSPHLRQVVDEGQTSVRRFVRSLLYFFSLMGKISTESNPFALLLFDEVQEMPLDKLDKALKRQWAQPRKIKIFGSTANFEGSDIDYFFQRSDQRQFHTRCGCADGVILAQCWDVQEGPTCIDRRPVESRPGAVPRNEEFYYCPACKTIVPDAQDGTFVAHQPGVENNIGVSYPMMLSPYQSAASVLYEWQNRIDTAGFYRRGLGRPYTDPNAVPITDAVLNAAQDTTLRWGPPKRHEVDAVYMGIDQRQHELHVVIKAKAGSRQQLLHLEVIQAANTWARLRPLMREYHVRHACLEALPNTDPAYDFAKEFPGQVFVVDGYRDMTHQMIAWGDRIHERETERHSADEFKTPFTVIVDRYKMMSLALNRWAKGGVVMPDARGLVQKGVRTDTGKRDLHVCDDMFRDHMKHVALVTEPVEGNELKLRPVVKKLGPKDPHFAFANMLCDVAYARDWGTQQILGDVVPRPKPAETAAPAASSYNDQLKQKLPGEVASALPSLPGANKPRRLTCNDCAWFEPDTRKCQQLDMLTTPDAPKCDSFVPVPQEDKEWR